VPRVPQDRQDPTAPPEPRRRGGPVRLFGTDEDLKQVLDHLPAGVVAHAPDTSIRVCNQRACDILGLTMDEIIGVRAPDPRWCFLRPDGTPMPVDEFPVNLVLRTRQPVTDLVVGSRRPATDDITWALCTGYPVVDDRDELQLVIITFIDITAQRRAEAERARLEARLRHSTKMEAIGRLAGGIAHDFNNLLTGIMGYAELIEASLDPDHRARPWATEILDSSRRAADLVGQLLAFASQRIVEPQVIQPNRVLARCENILGRLLGEDIELVVRPAADLWNVRVDPSQIDQVLVNLAVNARDAMPAGGHLSIETANATLHDASHPMIDGPINGNFVVISVSDDGQGMDAQTRKRIFEPFFSTKGPGEGTGLGLSTVYGIVAQAGGFITVHSAPGHGTTFKLYLPATDQEVDEPRPAQAPVVEGGEATILLVEDDDTVRSLARDLLSDHGYAVIEAADPAEAERLASRFPGRIDLLLTDVVMPGTNGRQLHERLARQRSGLRVLYMSGYTHDIIAHHGVLHAGTDFLPKPFTSQQLLHRVGQVLGRP
ncbi:MAG: response regulator, partial [Deltaproteobacteria bacterium]